MNNENVNMDENRSSCNFKHSSSNIFQREVSPTATADNDVGNPRTFDYQTRQAVCGTFGVAAHTLLANLTRNEQNIVTSKEDINSSDPAAPICHLELDSVRKLKNSTKHLLCLLKEIKDKTSSKFPNCQLDESLKQSPKSSGLPSEADLGPNTINLPEILAETINQISIEDEDNAHDCSTYKRLTRKCNCMNREEYNDFMIHFNEATKYFTSTMGEIIKNMRILKKFLYMGGDYTKRTLIFLNESYAYSTYIEKVEITKGCAHADICNIFDDHSIVTVCISGVFRDENYRDATTQAKAALLLNQLAQLEEGRRYLNFSSKIINEIRKVVRTRSSLLEIDTLESLNATLNLLSLPVTQTTSASYYCKPVGEGKGFGSKTVTALLEYRQNMTLEEVFTQLDLLYSLTTNSNGIHEIAMILPALLVLFEQMLIEYDNREVNISVTNIMNNVVSRGMAKKSDLPKTIVVADTGTEPIHMQDEINQYPFKTSTGKEIKPRIRVDVSSLPTKLRQPFEEKDFGNIIQYPSKKSTRKKNKSKIMLNVSASPTRLGNTLQNTGPNNSVIVVPIEGMTSVFGKSSIFKDR